VTLAGRRALVTGGSGGIGGALAVHLARAGADVVLTYGAHRQEADAAADRVRALGRGATVLRAELGEPSAGRDLVARVTAESGPLDVLVANAGLGTRVPWDEVDDDLWARTFAVNTTAPWQLARAALPGMVDRGFGRVLFVSSVAALNGGVVGPHYAASKAALHGLMHHLAPRVAPSGVTVNALAPALIEGTRMLPSGDGGALPMPVPVGHLGRPDDVAAMAVAMLANPYLTDKVITLDGGLYPS
jgi:3-oxoacyl-[acyl-carrier protein] reductase